MMEIQCRCGAVRVELSGKAKAQFFCHCDDCQAVHGAAYVPVAMYAASDVVVTRGSTIAWKVRTTPRRTCVECGTRLFAEVPQLGLCGVVGSLLPKGGFNPAFHMNCQFAVRPVVDDLPHFKSVPAAFGGSDERVAW
jgi:hypothetical protein